MCLPCAFPSCTVFGIDMYVYEGCIATERNGKWMSLMFEEKIKKSFATQKTAEVDRADVFLNTLASLPYLPLSPPPSPLPTATHRTKLSGNYQLRFLGCRRGDRLQLATI